jgi:hypothetical protein
LLDCEALVIANIQHIQSNAGYEFTVNQKTAY